LGTTRGKVGFSDALAVLRRAYEVRNATVNSYLDLAFGSSGMEENLAKRIFMRIYEAEISRKASLLLPFSFARTEDEGCSMDIGQPRRFLRMALEIAVEPWQGEHQVFVHRCSLQQLSSPHMSVRTTEPRASGAQASLSLQMG
jgi:hypothetical protein